jgi:hypothetical protein
MLINAMVIAGRVIRFVGIFAKLNHVQILGWGNGQVGYFSGSVGIQYRNGNRTCVWTSLHDSRFPFNCRHVEFLAYYISFEKMGAN